MFFFSKRCEIVQTRKQSRHLSIKIICKRAAIVVGLAAIVYLLNSHWLKKGSKHIVPFSIYRKTVDLSCFFFGDAKVTKSKAIMGNQSIFLISSASASACEPLDLRKTCTVESAAKTHPEWTVHVILYGREKNERNTKIFVSKLKAYQNIVITRIDLPEYFIGTPLESLLARESLKKTKFPERLVSDLVKLATLYNHGGVGLSWNVFVERSLRTLSNDFFVKEPENKVSSTVLRLSKNEVGKEVIRNIVRCGKYNKYYVKYISLSY